MSNIYLNRFSVPVVTGKPIGEKPVVATPQKEGTPSFNEVLQNQVKLNSNLAFSKHAAIRVEQRGIDMSETNLARLNEGVKIAGEKGLNDTLILIDKTAFIVSVKNNTVITTVTGEELKGNVFTNIDGTVII